MDEETIQLGDLGIVDDVDDVDDVGDAATGPGGPVAGREDLGRLDAQGFDSGVLRSVPTRRRVRYRSRVLDDVGRGAASFVLGGFSTVELVAIAVAYLGLTGNLWLGGTIDFERLFTDPLLRSVWLLLVLAMVRPITWLPYVAALAGYRRLAEVAAPRLGEVARNAVANAATIVTLVVIGIIAIGAIPGATGAVRAGTAIVLGNGSFDDVGAARVDWTFVRVVAVMLAVVLGRLFVPPLGLDLDRSDEPILDYPSGRRGTFDRWLLALALASSVVLVGLGVLHRVRG
jgi:hypothetical protein